MVVKMLHKTLKSYQNNDPWDDREEHPDGPLWLVTQDELLDTLPHGVLLETISGKEEVHTPDLDQNIKAGDVVTCNSRNGTEYLGYGIRGWRTNR